MSALEAGKYVVHAKLPELGSGEIVSSEKGNIRIRFSSGERNFRIELVSPHLSATDEAPAKAKKAKAKAKPKAKSKPLSTET